MEAATVQLDYTQTTRKGFDETVQAVIDLVAANGFRVLHVHDVQGTFKEKGFDREPYKIIEVCNVKYAKQALEKDLLIGLMMPCKINVYTENGLTKVSLMRPSLLARFFPAAELQSLGDEVEGILKKVVDASV